MAERQVITATSNGITHGRGMCVAVKANGFLFISALRGHPAGKPDDMSDETAEQARQAFENLKLIMEEVGGSLQDVVKVTVYFHDLKYREEFHKVWMEYWPTDPPARMGIEVSDANTRPGRNAHFALDVIALAP